jgi:membrane associated rhomboid family serine protease
MLAKNSTVTGSLKTMAVFIAILWIILILSYLLPVNSLGIRPRSLAGLPGIIFAPLLHGGFSHLIGNSISLLVLGTFLLSVEGRRSAGIFLLLILFSGAGTWIIGRSDSIHIGASGLIYGIIGYLLFYGIFKRSIGSILVSVVIFIFYGGAIWGVFPSGTFVSWEMHLCGFLSGIIIARMSIRRQKENPDPL